MEFFCSFSHGIECIKISLCSECEIVSDIVYFVISEYGYHLCDTAIEFSFLISIIPPLCDSFLCHLHIIAVLTIGDMRNGSAMDKIIIENRNVGVKLIFCNFNYIVFIIVICVFSNVSITSHTFSNYSNYENTIRRVIVPEIGDFINNVYYHTL